MEKNSRKQYICKACEDALVGHCTLNIPKSPYESPCLVPTAPWPLSVKTSIQGRLLHDRKLKVTVPNFPLKPVVWF